VIPASPQPRPPFALIAVVLVYAAVGVLILLLAAVVGGGVITWDVKGFYLTGWRLALFSLALASIGAIALLTARLLWRGAPPGRPLAIGFWFYGGAVGLITDRSVAGPGEPLRAYLVDMGLAPAALAAVMLYAIPGVRRFFASPDRR
jgi:hypothetical protein